jgi:hypothetical protein
VSVWRRGGRTLGVKSYFALEDFRMILSPRRTGAITGGVDGPPNAGLRAIVHADNRRHAGVRGPIWLEPCREPTLESRCYPEEATTGNLSFDQSVCLIVMGGSVERNAWVRRTVVRKIGSWAIREGNDRPVDPRKERRAMGIGFGDRA